MFDSVINKLEQWAEPFKNFVIEHGDNPIFFGGLFLAGVLIFAITYSALNKND